MPIGIKCTRARPYKLYQPDPIRKQHRKHERKQAHKKNSICDWIELDFARMRVEENKKRVCEPFTFTVRRIVAINEIQLLPLPICFEANRSMFARLSVGRHNGTTPVVVISILYRIPCVNTRDYAPEQKKRSSSSSPPPPPHHQHRAEQQQTTYNAVVHTTKLACVSNSC